MKKLITISILTVFVSCYVKGQNNLKVPSSEMPDKVTIPFVNNCQIKIDGLFPEGEWKGALNFKISESFEILFLVNSENLFIGLKYAGKVADYKQALDCVSELYIATNSVEFYNLHSSARLAEGINKFSINLKQAKYSLENVNGWEANFGSHVRDNNLKCNGVEYRISLNKVANQSIKLALNIIAVNFTFRESAMFPQNFSFKDSNKWFEITLPNSSPGAK